MLCKTFKGSNIYLFILQRLGEGERHGPTRGRRWLWQTTYANFPFFSPPLHWVSWDNSGAQISPRSTPLYRAVCEGLEMRLWTLLAFSGTFLCGLLLPLTYCAEEQRIPEGKGANNCAITYSKHILSRCHSVTTAMAIVLCGRRGFDK